MNVGATIRGARQAAALTQAELAARSGTSQPTLSMYEGGGKTPSAETLVRILAAAGVRVVPQPATRPVRTPGARQLHRLGRALERVVALADALPARHPPDLAYPRLPARPGPAG